jgi:hypothetical protein
MMARLDELFELLEASIANPGPLSKNLNLISTSAYPLPGMSGTSADLNKTISALSMPTLPLSGASDFSKWLLTHPLCREYREHQPPLI